MQDWDFANEFDQSIESSVFTFVYDQYQNLKSDEDIDEQMLNALIEKFHTWWINITLPERVSMIKNHYVEPKGSAKFTEINGEDIIGYIINSSISRELQDYSYATDKGPFSLRLHLFELLNQIDELGVHPERAHNHKLAKIRHLVGAKVLSYLAIHDPTPDNIQRLENYAKQISGHDRKLYKIIGGILITLGILIAVSALCVTTPAAAPFVNFASDTMLAYYITSFIASYTAIMCGAAMVYLSSATGLSLWTQNVAQSISQDVPSGKNKPSSTGYTYLEEEDVESFSTELGSEYNATL